MLLRLLKDLIVRRAKTETLSNSSSSAITKAVALTEKGDPRSAIVELRKHLDQFPHDVVAINVLGCHLSDTGDQAGAYKCFELAYSLDDSFMPGVVNYAKLLTDQQRSEEGLKLLWEAKSFNPDVHHVDGIYGSLMLARGLTSIARRHALRAWLGSFDTLRPANCYQMYSAYDEIDEAILAAEHKFWGETLAPPLSNTTNLIDSEKQNLPPPKKNGKIRIGYWSPDFRTHSVTYFFRPLLDNQDRTRFEVFLYHDCPVSDNQTAEIRKAADGFFEVSAYPDRQLVSLIKSHELDIIVELAGHTSTNRLPLLRERMATLQISGIGYPPTTGLTAVDAKLADVHIADEDSKKYYTEELIVLPSSFWCFDPCEEQEPPITPEPPAIKNGHITFACVGNIAKISQRIIRCWVEILQQVPNSKLMLRSIAFNDEAAINYFRQRMVDAGIPLDRLSLLKPAKGSAFLASYNEIDVVLDTFPFNGGTTTSFATYMGVPVVSLAGKSLITRMGKSILANLDMSDWTVETETDYVARAVEASSDVEALRRFRAKARHRFRNTALGNGKIFALDFENACISLLEKQRADSQRYPANIPDLDPEELIRRAYFVLQTGQEAAAQRIVDYCLRAHPSFGAAHILWTQRITGEERFKKAAEYLLEKLDSFDPNTRTAAYINIARNFLLSADRRSAQQAITKATELNPSDVTDKSQLKLLESALSAYSTNGIETHNLASIAQPVVVEVFLVCDEALFSYIVDRTRASCRHPDGYSIKYVYCPETKKGKHLSAAIYESSADVVIWLNKNISICNEMFFNDIVFALENDDVISFYGATIYDRLDWRRSESSNKGGSYLSPSPEKEGYFEVQIIGNRAELLVKNMAILDGGLLAFSPTRMRRSAEFDFDPFLESAATMMEEYFSHQCHVAGLRLAAHQSLGLMIDWNTPLLSEHLGEARWHLAQKLEFDPFEHSIEDRMIISAPVESAAIGVNTQRIYFNYTKGAG